MKRSVTFPMKIESENTYRSIDQRRMMANMARTKKQRSDVMLFLASFPKPPHYMAPERDGAPPPANHITVTLTRISPGRLDKEENLTGGFKGVKDAVAEWCGIRDDSDSRFTWLYAQQGCPLREFGARIEIEDMSPGADIIRILGNVPARMSLVKSEGGAKRIDATRAQERVFTRPCLAAPPWLEDGVVVEMPAVEGEPPESVRMRVPANALTSSLCRLRPGTLVELFRTEAEDEELGPVWLYATR